MGIIKTLLSVLIISMMSSCEGLFDDTKKADILINEAWSLRHAWILDLENGHDSQKNYMSTARKKFDQAIEVAPNYSKSYFNKALSEIFIDREKDDISRFFHTEYNGGEVSIYSKESHVEKYKKIIPLLNKAIFIDSTFYDAYYFRAIAKQESGDFESAISDFKIYIDNESKYYETYKVGAELRLAMAMYSNKQFRDVVRLLKNYKVPYRYRTKDFFYNPNIESLNIKGKSRLRLDDFYGAILDFTKALDYLSGNEIHMAKIYNNRGLAYIKLNKFDIAMNDFDSAININPIFINGILLSDNSYYSYDSSGLSKEGAISLIYKSYCKDKLKISGFANEMHKALGLDNNNSEILVLAGKMIFNRGYVEDACKKWSKAGELGSDEAYELIKKHCN